MMMYGDMEKIQVVIVYFKAITGIYPVGLRKTMKNLFK
jgi:hypothetical protein